MVVLRLHTPLASLALSASTHGMSDALNPRHLWPYALVPIPFPYNLSTYLFFTASCLHFAEDTDLKTSVTMHACLGILSRIHFSLASTLMCIYYIGWHFPLHMIRTYKRSKKMALFISLLFCVLSFAIGSHCEFELSEWVQRAVAAHAVTEAQISHSEHQVS